MRNTLTEGMCERCGQRAIFTTPHGIFCLDHTLDEMNADPILWMPRRIDGEQASDKVKSP
jgi:hypothetical protein